MSGGTLTAGTLTNGSTMRWTGGALALTTNGTLANSGTLTIGANGQRPSRQPFSVGQIARTVGCDPGELAAIEAAALASLRALTPLG
jgi:hypothetical protein